MRTSHPSMRAAHPVGSWQLAGHTGGRGFVCVCVCARVWWMWWGCAGTLGVIGLHAALWRPLSLCLYLAAPSLAALGIGQPMVPPHPPFGLCPVPWGRPSSRASPCRQPGTCAANANAHPPHALHPALPRPARPLVLRPSRAPAGNLMPALSNLGPKHQLPTHSQNASMDVVDLPATGRARGRVSWGRGGEGAGGGGGGGGRWRQWWCEGDGGGRGRGARATAKCVKRTRVPWPPFPVSRAKASPWITEDQPQPWLCWPATPRPALHRICHVVARRCQQLGPGNDAARLHRARAGASPGPRPRRRAVHQAADASGGHVDGAGGAEDRGLADGRRHRRLPHLLPVGGGAGAAQQHHRQALCGRGKG